MKTFEANWKSKDGIDFFVRGWEPDHKPKALIVLVHGLGFLYLSHTALSRYSAVPIWA